jgi:hypothetical protein
MDEDVGKCHQCQQPLPPGVFQMLTAIDGEVFCTMHEAEYDLYNASLMEGNPSEVASREVSDGDSGPQTT